MNSSIEIRQAEDKDIAGIVEIYNQYILNTTATFEIEPVSLLEMKRRVQEKLEQYDWLIGEVDRQVIGYAYYGSFRSRPAYNHTVELTVYLAKERIGQGFGKALYRELIESAQAHGFRELVGVIALPNQGSIKLHQQLGFTEVGVLKRVGHKFDQDIDVGIWQKSV